MVDEGSRIRFDLESVSFPKTQHMVSCAFLPQAYDRSGGVMGRKVKRIWPMFAPLGSPNQAKT
jgi:hypothetical protein